MAAACSDANAPMRAGTSFPVAARSWRARSTSHASTSRPMPRPRHRGCTPPSRNVRTTLTSPGGWTTNAHARSSPSSSTPASVSRAMSLPEPSKRSAISSSDVRNGSASATSMSLTSRVSAGVSDGVSGRQVRPVAVDGTRTSAGA